MFGMGQSAFFTTKEGGGKFGRTNVIHRLSLSVCWNSCVPVTTWSLGLFLLGKNPADLSRVTGLKKKKKKRAHFFFSQKAIIRWNLDKSQLLWWRDLRTGALIRCSPHPRQSTAVNPASSHQQTTGLQIVINSRPSPSSSLIVSSGARPPLSVRQQTLG